MSAPYQRPFARYYDLLYSDKDYEAECDLIEQVFERYSTSTPRSVLDAGCGSGGHSVSLARRGFEVTGVDRADGLLERARKKAENAGGAAEFHEADLRDFTLHRQFDACVSMFAVLSFQISNDDVQRTLRRIREHLAPGGLFVLDVWHGPAVLIHRSEKRLKAMDGDGIRLLRFATPTLDVMRHVNQTEHRILAIDKDSHLADEVVEKQDVRYFFPQELAFHLDVAGFDTVRLFSFPHLDKEATQDDWELGVVARAK